jgi:DNA-binding NarL/FixJ family response regulator
VIVAIRKILSGVVYASDKITSHILAEKRFGRSDTSMDKRLSDRELQVFQLIGQWKGTRQIAGELHLSIKTVEYYREQIKKKLQLKDGSQLVQQATIWSHRHHARL